MEGLHGCRDSKRQNKWQIECIFQTKHHKYSCNCILYEDKARLRKLINQELKLIVYYNSNRELDPLLGSLQR